MWGKKGSLQSHLCENVLCKIWQMKGGLLDSWGTPPITQCWWFSLCGSGSDYKLNLTDFLSQHLLYYTHTFQCVSAATTSLSWLCPLSNYSNLNIEDKEGKALLGKKKIHREKKVLSTDFCSFVNPIKIMNHLLARNNFCLEMGKSENRSSKLMRDWLEKLAISARWYFQQLVSKKSNY